MCLMASKAFSSRTPQRRLTSTMPFLLSGARLRPILDLLNLPQVHLNT